MLTVTLALTIAAVPFLGEEFLPNFRELRLPDALGREAGHVASRHAAYHRRRRPKSCARCQACTVSARTSDARKRPTKSSAPTSPSSGSPSTRTSTTRRRSRTSRRSSMAIPDLQRDLLTYLRERVKEVLTGASATIVVRIFGPDLDQLTAQAQKVAGAIGKIDGVADLKVQAQVLVPQIEVRYRPEKAQLVGVSSARRAPRRDDARAGHEGRGDLRRPEDVRRRGVGKPGGARQRVGDSRVGLQTPGGGIVPLDAAADVVVAPTPNEITRERGSRRIDVTCNVRGRDLGAVAQDIQAALGGVTFPAEYHAELLGEYAAQAESRNRLLTLAGFALLGIFLLLFVDFGEARPAVARVRDAAVRAGRRRDGRAV